MANPIEFTVKNFNEYAERYNNDIQEAPWKGFIIAAKFISSGSKTAHQYAEIIYQAIKDMEKTKVNINILKQRFYVVIKAENAEEEGLKLISSTVLRALTGEEPLETNLKNLIKQIDDQFNIYTNNNGNLNNNNNKPKSIGEEISGNIPGSKKSHPVKPIYSSDVNKNKNGDLSPSTNSCEIQSQGKSLKISDKDWNLLLAKSRYFKLMTQSLKECKGKKIIVNDIKLEDFEIFIKFLQGEIPTADTIYLLYELSQRLMCEEQIKKCCDIFSELQSDLKSANEVSLALSTKSYKIQCNDGDYECGAGVWYLLISKSKYFNSMLTGNFKEAKESKIIFPDIELEDFKAFIKFFLKEQEPTKETILLLIELSDRFLLEEQLEKCHDYYSKLLLNENKETFLRQFKNHKDNLLLLPVFQKTAALHIQEWSYIGNDNKLFNFLNECVKEKFPIHELSITNEISLNCLKLLKELPLKKLRLCLHSASLNKLSSLQDLKSLQHLEFVNLIIEENKLRVIKNLITLKSLNLFKSGICDEALIHLKDLTSLQHLDVSFNRITGNVFANFNHLPLKSLKISNTLFENKNIINLKAFSSLEYLNFSACKITDEGLIHLKDLPSLQHLDVTFTGITGSAFAEFENLESLQYLDISHTAFISKYLINLINFPSLKYLNLNCNSLNDSDLVFLEDLASLEHLSLIDCSSLTDTTLMKILKRLKGLKHLNLKSCNAITEKGFANINGLTSIEHLNISDCNQIKDFAFLSDLPSLIFLDISGCKQINDLAFLLDLVNLQQLYINRCETLTDQDMYPLERLDKLVSFNMIGCPNLSYNNHYLTPMRERKAWIW